MSGTYTPDESTSKVLGTQDVGKKAKGTGKARDEIPILQGQVESLKREKQEAEESCRTQVKGGRVVLCYVDCGHA